MGQITFKGGSITFKGGSLTFLNDGPVLLPMADPTVDAFWNFSGGVYTSRVYITNNDTQDAQIFYKINDALSWTSISLRPGESTTIWDYSSSTRPANYIMIKGEAYATDPFVLRGRSEFVTDTAYSDFIPSMENPTVIASWSLIAGKYTSKVTIKNNDTQIARMWYRVDEFPSAGQYQNIGPGDTYTIIKSESDFPPAPGLSIKGEARATDPNNLKEPSETVTHTGYWD